MNQGRHLDAYRAAISEHGAGFSATLWGSPETQSLRFEVIHEMTGGLARQRVLDLGCGDGAFARWLVQHGEPPDLYLGLDAIEDQVHHAQSKSPLWARFRIVDLSKDWQLKDRFDWVVLSGTLNTMDDDLVHRVLTHAWNACDVGLAFNFLSDQPHARWREKDLGPARRLELSAWYAWALERSDLVTCRHEYLDGHDATLVIRRPESS